jgi:hypothetical protein
LTIDYQFLNMSDESNGCPRLDSTQGTNSMQKFNAKNCEQTVNKTIAL